MSRFSAIDLSQMTPPDIVEALSFKTILAEQKADFKARWELVRETKPDLPPYDVEMLESDPAVILMEVSAYRELGVRARVNEAARALLVATSSGNDLDHLAAWYTVERLVGESDDRFRRRAQLAPEAFSTAGSKGAYLFHVLSLTLDVEDVALSLPAPGTVNVHVLVLDGVDEEALLAKINARLHEQDIKPLTDTVVVLAARRTLFELSISLEIGLGPDPSLIEASVLAAVEKYLADRRKIGKRLTVSGLGAAAHVGGVEKVILSIIDDIDPGIDGVAIATSINIETQVIS